jgi:hypothetical protein
MRWPAPRSSGRHPSSARPLPQPDLRALYRLELHLDEAIRRPADAQRVGLLNTTVFTHLPANVCLVLAALSPSLPVALGLLMIRIALSSMDVPTRTACRRPPPGRTARRPVGPA